MMGSPLIWSYVYSAILVVVSVIVMRYWAIRREYSASIVPPIIISLVWYGLGYLYDYIRMYMYYDLNMEISQTEILMYLIVYGTNLLVGTMLALLMYRTSMMEAAIMIGAVLVVRFIVGLIWELVIWRMIYQY
jgi:hypothetical protein